MEIKDIISKVGEDNIRQAVESEDDNALKSLLESEGIALSDDQLEHIAGGVLVNPRTPTRPHPRTTPASGGSDYIDTDDPNSPNWTGPEDDYDSNVTDDWGLSD